VALPQQLFIFYCRVGVSQTAGGTAAARVTKPADIGMMANRNKLIAAARLVCTFFEQSSP